VSVTVLYRISVSVRGLGNEASTTDSCRLLNAVAASGLSASVEENVWLYDYGQKRQCRQGKQ